jgi:thiamine biosynthesis lipoprotein
VPLEATMKKTDSLDLARSLDRRGFLAFGAGLFAVAGVPLAMYRRATHPPLVRRSLPVMGTIAEVVVVHPDAARGQAAIDAAFDALKWVETTMTRFTTTSDIGRANVGAARAPVSVSRETALVVAEALRWARATNGRYDPAVGQTVAVWDVLNRHSPPAERETAYLADRGLYRGVLFDADECTLGYGSKDIQLDLGSIAKGYAVDHATEALRAHGIEHAVVVAGGDLYALGRGPDGEAWTIGIRDPHDMRATVGTLAVSDAAVATSGTYVRYFMYRGARYHHLMDPEIAAPRRTPVESFTIRADRCMHADVATTALFGMEKHEASPLLARMAPGARIESMLL